MIYRGRWNLIIFVRLVSFKEYWHVRWLVCGFVRVYVLWSITTANFYFYRLMPNLCWQGPDEFWQTKPAMIDRPWRWEIFIDWPVRFSACTSFLYITKYWNEQVHKSRIVLCMRFLWEVVFENYCSTTLFAKIKGHWFLQELVCAFLRVYVLSSITTVNFYFYRWMLNLCWHGPDEHPKPNQQRIQWLAYAFLRVFVSFIDNKILKRTSPYIQELC